METATSLSQIGSFEPHGQCFLWNSDLVLLHAVSDSITALAYYSIPIALFYFVKKRQDLPYKWMFVLFGAFILACGTTHLMAAWTIWKPDYWLEGTIKGVTAAISLVTAGLLWPMIPHALRLPSPAQMAAANQELQKEIVRRQQTEATLTGILQDLEREARERTADLSQTNKVLQSEIAERKQAEIQLRRLNRALKTLSAGNAAVVRARQEQDLLQNICRLLVETGSYRFAWIGCAEQDEHKTVRPLSKAGHEDGYLGSVTFTWADNKLGQGPAGTAIRTGQTQVARDIATNPNYTPWRAEAMKRGYASIIAIPLCEKGRPFGALIAYSKEPDDFDENEVALLQELAQDLEYGIMALRSLTELTQLADKLRTSSDYARSLIEASLDPLGTINTDGKITDVNTAAEAITGLPRERLIGSDFWTYFTEPDKAREVYPQVLAQGVVRDYPLTIRHASGRLMDVLYNATVYCDNKGAVQGVLATARDITERKRMEEQAARVEHLATLGKLLSGISHEIKNPLFVMTGRVQLLKEKLANREYDASAQDISIIENAGKRMTEITQRFLNIARPLKPQWQRCSVHDVLAQLLEFIANELMKNRIQVVRAFAPDVPETWSEPRQLHQVFLNLILNAMQAIAAARGQGTLTITTGRENDSIIIRIQDDGPGIAPQNRVKLFEPFFSTKPPEQGTGLGLWTVRSTLTELNGTVQCESEEGEGATFIVSIPIVSHPSKE